MGYKYIKMMLPSSKYNIKAPYKRLKPTSITVHNTDNNAPAKNEVSYMIGNRNKVSFHYAVDDKYVVKGVTDTRGCYHCGNSNGNKNSLSVEICYSTGDLKKFKASEANAALFIAKKLIQYDLTVNDVYTHHHWNGKNCPARTMKLGWSRFKRMIKKEYNRLNKQPTPVKPAEVVPAKVIKKTSSKKQVVWLQKSLNKLYTGNGKPLEVDGKWGMHTSNRLNAYRKQLGWKEATYATEATVKALKSGRKK